MKTLVIMLIGLVYSLTLTVPLQADGHLPACHFKHMVVNECNPCAPKCYWVKCYSEAGSETGWCEDPYLRLCFEVPRPRCCHPTPVPDCVPHGTCQSSPSCCCVGSCQCVAVVKGAGCGCEKGNNTVPILAVPTPAPAPTMSIMQQSVRMDCSSGQCVAVPPNNQQAEVKGKRGWIFQRNNPNVFGADATGSGNRIVNIFGRQQVQLENDRLDGTATNSGAFWKNQEQDQRMTEEGRRGLFGRRR